MKNILFLSTKFCSDKQSHSDDEFDVSTFESPPKKQLSKPMNKTEEGSLIEGYGIPQNYQNMRLQQQPIPQESYQKSQHNFGYSYGEEFHQNPSFHSNPTQMGANYPMAYPMGYIPPPIHPSYQSHPNMN